MAPTNGNNAWVRWLVGTLWGVIVMVIMFMGNVVRGNDLANRDEHATIVEGSIKRDAAQGQEIEHIKEIVTDIRLEQRSMQSDLKHSFESLEKKL